MLTEFFFLFFTYSYPLYNDNNDHQPCKVDVTIHHFFTIMMMIMIIRFTALSKWNGCFFVLFCLFGCLGYGYGSMDPNIVFFFVFANDDLVCLMLPSFPRNKKVPSMKMMMIIIIMDDDDWRHALMAIVTIEARFLFFLSLLSLFHFPVFFLFSSYYNSPSSFLWFFWFKQKWLFPPEFPLLFFVVVIVDNSFSDVFFNSLNV